MGGTEGQTEQIARAIAARSGLQDALKALSEDLSASELGSLLLHILRLRSRSVTFPDVMHLAERDNLVNVSNVDARLLHVVDGAGLEAADGFDAVELSPVSAFGMNALAGIDQNNVLSALRNAEVVSDPTSALAVECAVRRKRGDRSIPTRLATSARCIRMQRLDDPSFSRHFRLFALVSAVRGGKDDEPERQELHRHLHAWLTMVMLLNQRGFDIHRTRVEVADTRLIRALLLDQDVPLETLQGYVSPQRWDEEIEKRRLRFPGILPALNDVLVPPAARGTLERLSRVEQDVFVPLRAEFPWVTTAFDLQRLHAVNYYHGLAFHLILATRDGREFPVGDGGFTTWTQSLLSDRSERFLGSALGSEFLCRVFVRGRSTLET